MAVYEDCLVILLTITTHTSTLNVSAQATRISSSGVGRKSDMTVSVKT